MEMNEKYEKYGNHRNHDLFLGISNYRNLAHTLLAYPSLYIDSPTFECKYPLSHIHTNTQTHKKQTNK